MKIDHDQAHDHVHDMLMSTSCKKTIELLYFFTAKQFLLEPGNYVNCNHDNCNAYAHGNVYGTDTSRSRYSHYKLTLVSRHVTSPRRYCVHVFVTQRHIYVTSGYSNVIFTVWWNVIFTVTFMLTLTEQSRHVHGPV